MSMIRLLSFFVIVMLAGCNASENTAPETNPPTTKLISNEPHRPLIHFTPKEKWMNDPNGMVFFNNQYHLFYQYYPDSTVWGPMHWGHAISSDLVHWEHQPIALYPDSLGYIFSGSAVADVDNTSGFGEDGKVPLVAMFTHHDPKGEKEGSNTFQNQSLAYSLDEGKTWTKYVNNPVLKNPGIRDFRDPKLRWHEETKKWIMTLATLDRVTFFSSPNLKDWTKESEFGKDIGAHGGVWECPDLFPLEYNNEKIWILVVSLNPGGPNGGSATQYFTGRFDGQQFTPLATDTRWIDYGPDNYAGVTWSNTGKRTIFLGWMSNWQYATVVPTEKWRSAMTIPRELGIARIGEKFYVTSKPVSEMDALAEKTVRFENVDVRHDHLTQKIGAIDGAVRFDIKSNKRENFSITLSNTKGQKLVMGYDGKQDQYFIDRSGSGKTAFEKGFGAKHTAPRLSRNEGMDLTLIIDVASVELFADGGLTVMTEVFFPDENYRQFSMQATESFIVNSLQYSRLKSIQEPSSLAVK